MSDNSSQYVGQYNIDGLPQGTDFSIYIDYQTGDTPTTVDLTDYTGKLQVRRNYGSAVLLELKSDDGEIVFSDTAPNIAITFPASKTSSMTIYEDMIYDLLITSTGLLSTRVIEGCFSIDRQVTI